MTDEAKRPFVQANEREKERYVREMEAYKKSVEVPEPASKLGKRPAAKPAGKASANKR